MYRPPIAPLAKPAQGPAKIPHRKMASWKKCMAEVKLPNCSGMASGGRDMMLAKAAMSAANATVFVFSFLLCPCSVIFQLKRNTK